jgi:hypothetical protein
MAVWKYYRRRDTAAEFKWPRWRVNLTDKWYLHCKTKFLFPWWVSNLVTLRTYTFINKQITKNIFRPRQMDTVLTQDTSTTAVNQLLTSDAFRKAHIMLGSKFSIIYHLISYVLWMKKHDLTHCELHSRYVTFPLKMWWTGRQISDF